MNIVSLRNAATATLIAISAASVPAFAQDSTNVVTTQGDWTVFAASSPKECWAVSAPKATQNTKDGKPAQVNRGDIRLYVSYRPGQAGEVSFSGGYPFAPDSTVDLNIGGNKFNLFTEGENAWAASPAEDAKIIGALRAGASVVLTGRSSRGTTTADTFSLSGITAATNAAKERCAN